MNGTGMYIFLDNVVFYAYHGVGEQERIVGNTFRIDLRVRTNFSEAMQTDGIEGTVSYADLHAVLKEEMNISSRLLEHVAGRIINRIFDDFSSITEIELKLSKRNPPMGADLEAAGVLVCCEREKPI